MIDVDLNRLRARHAARDRSCGDCTACCAVMAVVELRKPSRRACDHVSLEGCRIHDTRPESCREFNCLWLRGAIDASARPDELGVFFDYFTVKRTDISRLIAFELWPGALNSPAARALLDALSRTHDIELSYRDGTWSTLTR